MCQARPINTDWYDRSAGAVADVFDISCVASFNYEQLTTVSDELFNAWNSSLAGNATIQQLITTLPTLIPPELILCQHYFVPNGAGGIAPQWDFRTNPKFVGNDNAIFVGKVLTNTSSSRPTQDIPWLHLGKVSGDIFDEVYRIRTVGGVAPSSVSLSGAHQAPFVPDPADTCAYACPLFSSSHQCVSGTTSNISVKYVAQYWIFGGSLGLGSG